MDTTVKKIVAIILVGMVLVFTLIYVLSLWEIIHFEISLVKILHTLFVIFIASVVILFIYAVFYKSSRGRGNFEQGND